MLRCLMSLFFYEDRTGRHLRSHVKVALVILAMIAAVEVVGAVSHNRMVAQVMATPRPLDRTLLLGETAPVEETILVDACPSDPASWTLSNNPIVPTSNLKALAPQCVYDNLERTAAWVYATSALGYTRADAAARLGLSLAGLIAYPASSQIMVLTDFKDLPQPVRVVAAADSFPLAEWMVDADGAPGATLTFSGCFSTTVLRGGQATTWGSNPIICQFFADYRTQYAVSSANGQLYTGQSVLNARRPLWFGYTGNGSWAWLGSGNEWDHDLSLVTSHAFTLTPLVMEEKYGMPVVPLPQNWQSAAGQAFSDALLAELIKGE